MAEWSQLPAELLELISRRLSSEIDLLRFRSVCSTWRYSIKALPLSPSRFPILPNDGISDSITGITWGFFLSKRTIYCIKPPHSLLSDQSSWIIKLGHDSPDRISLLNPLTRCPFNQVPDNSPKSVRLLNPLNRCIFKPIPDKYPKFFDFWNLEVHELCYEYVLQYIFYRPLATSIDTVGTLHTEKVAFSFNPKDGAFIVLTIHDSGKLEMYKSGNTKWTIINDLPAPYDDVIYYQSNFYAVDNTGRLVIVDSDSSECPSVTEVATPIIIEVATPIIIEVAAPAHPVYGGHKKFLVESCGDLLLVDMYMISGLGYSDMIMFFEEFDCFESEKTVNFMVFKLDRFGKSWIEVKDLGDRVLFLGDNCSFSASVSELSLSGKRNCIFFTDQLFYTRLGDGDWRNGVRAFDLENGSIGFISSYHGYSDVFWPPPDWIYPTTDVDETNEDLDGFDQLRV